MLFFGIADAGVASWEDYFELGFKKGDPTFDSVPRYPIPGDGGADGLPHVSWLDPNRNPKYRKLNLNYPDNRFNDNCVLKASAVANLSISTRLHFLEAGVCLEIICFEMI